MEKYNEQVKDYVETYSNDGCDFLEHRIRMSNYYRGQYNAYLKALSL